MNQISEIISLLHKGVIPVSKRQINVCLEIASVFNALVRYRRENPEGNESLYLTLLDLDTKDTESIQRIHTSWITQAFSKSVNLEQFDRLGIQSFDFAGFPNLCVLVSREQFVSKKCPICKSLFYSDVNRSRCFMAHDGKKLVSEHDREALVDFWDNHMTPAQKEGISVSTQAYLANICQETLIEPWMYRIIEIPEGDIAVSGEDLLDSLHIALECTSLYRVKNTGKTTRTKESTVQLHTTRDFICCIADHIIRQITILYAAHQEDQLMSAEDAPEKRRSTVQKKKKKMSRKQYLAWLDRKMFSATEEFVDWSMTA